MRIQTVREFDSADVEPSLLIENGQLSVRSDTQHFFAFRFSNRRLQIQPQGRVGVIPLNSRLAINVQPRTDIDLARILLVGGDMPALLPELVRAYTTDGQLLPSLLRLYAESLERAVLQLVERGSINNYNRVEEFTSSASGRILIDSTLRHLAATGQMHVAAVCRFDRARDTSVNDLLVEALYSLRTALDRSAAAVSSADQIAISRSLNHCLLRLAPTAPIRRKRFRDRYWNGGVLQFSSTHSYYENAVSISKAILEGCGVAFDLPSGPLEMRAIVINSAAAFESYVRKVLAENARISNSRFDVLDGNRSFLAGGAKKPLFESENSRAVTPDIVIRDPSNRPEFPLIVDVKYKPIAAGLDRTDLNQMLVYALVYRARRVLIVHLTPEGSLPGLTEIGTIRGIDVLRYSFDVSETAIRKQEAAFSEEILRLCSKQTS